MNIKGFIVLVLTILVSAVIVLMSLLFLSREKLSLIPRVYAWLSFKVTGVKFKVHGLENIDPNKSYIYISNHASLIDIPSVFLSLPKNVKFIAKKELFKVPLFGRALTKLGEIPIDRGNKRKAIESLKIAHNRLHTGSSIWMAPEGTRSTDGELGRFKKGAFMTAAQAGVEVVPVSLCGTWKVLPKKSFKMRGGNIDVFINKPHRVEKETIQNTLDTTHSIISNNIASWKSANA